MTQKISIAAVLLQVLLLTGCAGVSSVDPKDMSATHGYVFADCTALLPPECVLSLKNLKDGQEYTGIPLQDGPANGQGIWVPAGSYQLTNPSADSAPFDVQAGQLVGVGTFVAVNLGAYQSVSVPVINADFERHAHEVQRALSSHLRSIAWVNRTPAKPTFESTERYSVIPLDLFIVAYIDARINMPPERTRLAEAKTTAELFEIAKQLAPPLTDWPAVDQLGGLYFPGALGQIRKRTADAKWSSIDTGTLRNLSAVQVSGSTLVAGTDSGAIRVSQDDGKTWTSAAALNTSESVVGIDRIGGRWFVVTTYRNPLVYAPEKSQSKLYVADKPDLGDLRLVKTVPGLSGGAEATAQGYYFHTVPKTFLVDPVNLSMTPLDIPTETSQFSVSGDLIAALKAQGVFSKFYISKDRGKSWEQRDYPPYAVQSMHFNKDGTAIATRWSASAFTAALHTVRYDQAANKWDTIDEAPHTCKRILWDRNATPRYCVEASGSILRRDGQTQTWTPEVAVETRAPVKK